MGCYEVSLGDTLGVGSPSNTRTLIKFLVDNGIPVNRLAGHFHDTYGQALANVWEAYNCGIRVFDSSVAGLGGCPFAPGAKGNVATEDLVYMFNNAGVKTGVDLSKLVATGTWISQQLSKQTGSRAGAALASKSKPKQPSTIDRGPSSAKPMLAWTCIKTTDGLLVHRAGANLKVTMNRPKNGNTLTISMINDLISTYSDAAKDSTISRIVITGTGKFFCTGMDLGKDSTPVGAGTSSADAQFERLLRLFETIDTSPKVTISCLNGPAFGGGVGLAFACDIRLCAQKATVTLSEAKLGLCPATISKYVIREWGIPFAREAMLSARPISPKELKAKGVIFDIADDQAALEEMLNSLLMRLRVASSDATRMCKDLVRAGWAHGGREEQATTIKQLFREMMKPGAPGDYGVKEFQAGRKVDWDKYDCKEPSSKL
ncbi:ClpP/crotonase-like domain-containing protein [Dactylonectria macrodidyma]|uniref:hydroxymethylglutaryl-CoA lyase n=1 Tax=Dactylonectria macrodidyma TaxID=307937 RepID=A0A9P9JP73_9HYPO|nr:ClpP/crotonase-like domain-containing protein [Dactylonectria macrodidyma]